MPPLMDDFGYYTMRGGCSSIANPLYFKIVIGQMVLVQFFELRYNKK